MCCGDRTKLSPLPFSLPGAGAYDIFTRLYQKQIRLESYSIIFVATGTNDVANMKNQPTLIADYIMTLVWFIRQQNPSAIIGVCSMIIRPKDLGTMIEYRRHLVNSIVKRLCRAHVGVFFLQSFRCLMTRSGIRPRCYAHDGLHLNRTGARHIYSYLKGTITRLEGSMRL